MSPFCVFPPLLSPPLFPFSSPLFFPSHLLDSPLSPFCVFGLVFVFVCLVVGGCGVVCCVGVVCVWLGCGLWCLTWAWSGWVVPCWVRSGYVCVWLFALLCAFPFCVVLVGSSESDRQKDARTTQTVTERASCEHRARGSCLHAAWACARCTPIYSRRSTLPTRTLVFAPAQGVAL